MKKRLRYIDPIQAGKTVGAAYFCIGLLGIPFALLGAASVALSPQGGAAVGAGVAFAVMAVALPFVYGVMGFIGAALMAWFYNQFLVRWVGGFELEFEDIP